MKKHEWEQYSEIRHYCPHCENIKFVYDISIPNKWWDAKNHKWTTKEPECIERKEDAKDEKA